jgi:hypothetical protein
MFGFWVGVISWIYACLFKLSPKKDDVSRLQQLVLMVRIRQQNSGSRSYWQRAAEKTENPVTSLRTNIRVVFSHHCSLMFDKTTAFRPIYSQI